MSFSTLQLYSPLEARVAGKTGEIIYEQSFLKENLLKS